MLIRLWIKLYIFQLYAAFMCYFFRFRFKSTDKTIGAPINAVTEFTGKAPSNPGNRATRLQNKAKAAPTNTDAGMRMRWSDVWKRYLQRCGTASPKNEIGPQ